MPLPVSRIFEGHVFVLHPTTPNAYIRLDKLERSYNCAISDFCYDAQRGCGTRLSAYVVNLLSLLRQHTQQLSFPYNEIFNRCAERRGLLLDDLTFARAVRASEPHPPRLSKASA